MTPPSLAGAVVGGLYGHAVPEGALLGATAAVLAGNGVDLLVRPFRARPRGRPRRSPAVVLGFAIGLVGGAIGVILGTLRMPALLRGVGMDTRRAIGTNLVVGFALGVAGFAAHAARLEVDWPVLGAGLVGALPGAWFGARIAAHASELTLRRAIGVALLAVAAAFVVDLSVR
jgi:uncharacterized membrane protein YfcA